MERISEISQSLVDLGLAKPQADAYIQLLLLAETGPATGYQVAKALGRDATAVYKALDELKRRGAVETVAGRGKQYRPVPPAELLRKLGRQHSRLRRITEEGLSALTPPPNDEEVFRLHDREQVFDRFRSELAAVRRVALLDLSPRLYRRFEHDILRADRRGVVIVCKLYEKGRDKSAAEIEAIVDIEGDVSLELMPGDVLRGVFDCGSQLMAYLPRRSANGEVMLAYWSANAFMAYQAHQGLAGALQQTALKSALAGSETIEQIREKQDTLERLCYGHVDWEAFWVRCGLASAPREPIVSDHFVCQSRAEVSLFEAPMTLSMPQTDSLGPAEPLSRPSIQNEILQRKRRTVKKGRPTHERSHIKPDRDD